MGHIFHLLDEREVFSDHAGGAVSRWAANMLRNSVETIVCPRFDDSWGFPTERLYVLPKWSWTDPVHPLLYRLPWFLQRPIYMAIFRPLFDKLQPGDLVYVHNRPEAAAVLASASENYGFKVLLHMHNSHLNRANHHQKAALLHTPIVYVSEYLRTESRAAWPEHDAPTCVVYNGADENIFRPKPRLQRDLPEVIFTGRLVPSKGVHVLVKAMKILEDRRVKVRCTIVGAAWFGSKKKSLYTRKLEIEKAANTTMVGYFSGTEVANLLMGADIYCLPSVWKDPFPLSVLEALACGLPVIATRTGGIPEELQWGGGILIEPDDANSLADALDNVLGDYEYRRQLGEEAIAAYKGHFRWPIVRKQYECFLRELGYTTPEAFPLAHSEAKTADSQH